MLTTRPRGTSDILPDKVFYWRYLEEAVLNICKTYGYKEIRTPIFEHTELFSRGVGETTDIVEKEMYTFKDKGDRELSLRPEGTASTVRAFVENKLYADAQPTKLFYMGPMFRYGRPQAGRFRQFHQFGVEAFGSVDPSIDAEVISLAMGLMKNLGLDDLIVKLNSVGCPKCRPVHKEKLKNHLQKNFADLCPTCQGRYEKNPLRIFDCKNEKCQELVADAPTITECLCDECQEHLYKVQKYLKAGDIPFELDPYLVRGLDYYTKTAFEIVVNEIGAQSAICGGGRYDGLVDEIGGQKVPGIGFATGLERILLSLEIKNKLPELKTGLDVFVAVTSPELENIGFALLQELRNNDISAEKDYLQRSLKAQFKYADKLGCKIVLVLGDNEVKNGVLNLKNMESGDQKEVKLVEIVDVLKGILN